MKTFFVAAGEFDGLIEFLIEGIDAVVNHFLVCAVEIITFVTHLIILVLISGYWHDQDS